MRNRQMRNVKIKAITHVLPADVEEPGGNVEKKPFSSLPLTK
jgi:hypothetical protein